MKNRVRKEDEHLYTFDHYGCGAAIGLKKIIQTEAGGVISYCEECFKMQSIKKKCLRCEKDFSPGCSIKHVCRYCFNLNRYSQSEGLF